MGTGIDEVTTRSPVGTFLHRSNSNSFLRARGSSEWEGPHFINEPLKSIKTSLLSDWKKLSPSSPSQGKGSDAGLSRTTMSIDSRWSMNIIDDTVTLELDSGAAADCCWLD